MISLLDWRGEETGKRGRGKDGKRRKGKEQRKGGGDEGKGREDGESDRETETPKPEVDANNGHRSSNVLSWLHSDSKFHTEQHSMSAQRG